MGGSVGFESQAGLGASFWLELPERLAMAPASSPAPKPQAPLAGQQVLLAVAHAGVRQALTDMLGALGAQVGPAPAGDPAAWPVAALQATQLLIFDSALPASGTAQLVQRLRQRFAASVRLVALAPMSAGGDVDHDCRDADALLLRPVTPSSLQALAARLFGPRDTPAAAAAAVAVPRPDQLRFDAHVLLAEDAPLNREIASALLKNLGCRVSLAENGAAALQRVQQEPFDLVLMDCQMPELDGYETTRRIRAWEAGLQPPTALTIVALTANALSGDREACAAAGMSDYLSKPITAARLAAMLARHLPA